MKTYEYQKNYFLILEDVIHFSIGDIESDLYELNIQICTTDSERISCQYRSTNEVLEALKGLAEATKAFEIDKNNFLILDNVKHFSLERVNINIYQLEIQIGTSAGEYLSVQYNSRKEAEKSIKALAKAINERSVL